MRPWWVLLFIPLAGAGTPDAPEIVDAKDDNVSSVAIFGAPAADILAAWFFEDVDGLHASIRLDAPVCAEPSESIEYAISFDFQGASAFFGAIITGDPGGTDLCPDNAGGTSIRQHGQASGASFVGDTITVTLTPGVAATIGPVMTGLSVASKAYVGAAASTAVWSDTDRAPDSGAVAFTRVEEPAAPVTQYQNVTDAVLALAGNETSPRNGTLHVNWTAAPQRVALAFNATVVSGVVNATVRDSNGTVLFACRCDADQSEASVIDGAEGHWTVTLVFEAFVGDHRLRMEPAPAPDTTQTPSATATPSSTMTAGNTTSSDNGTVAPGKDAPWPAAMLLGALAVLAARRRW